MRAEIGGSNVSVLLRNQELPPSASIIFAAKMFVDALGDRLANVVAAGTPFERIPLNIPILPEVYKEMIGMTFVEDLQHRDVLSQDFLLPLELKSEEFQPSFIPHRRVHFRRCSRCVDHRESTVRNRQ
jgi:hypothetical protein